MAKKSIAELTAEIALPIVERVGCELVDVEYVKEGNAWFLRVFIDRPGGVTLDDCENVSRPLNEKLDELDPISHNFYLEVSSPGLERPLKKPKDFVRAMGSPVEIRLFKAVNGSKKYEGELLAYDGESLSIKTGNEETLHFKMEQVSKVKKVFKF